MLRYIQRQAPRTYFERPADMPAALHRLLIERGVASAEEAERFLHPDARSLHDPMRLSCMAQAVARIRSALAAGVAICVYGDYDVDGVSASAILSGWLRAQGADARVYLPSRHSEGYGLNERAVREIAGWAKLMVTVDCGVTAVELVALAKSLGLDVIVTDHHRPADALPDCPVVNPLLADYPFPFLCGAGVAWKLVWALAGEDAAMAWADVAALATVADVVPLTGENRAIVAMGLAQINASPRLGLRALVECAGMAGRRIDANAVAFQLAPRLNAGGRLGSAMRAYRLLATQDPGEAGALAEELDKANAERKTVEQRIHGEAEAQLADFDFPAHRALILAGEGWNPGVVGLAASRLVEKYHYPVILLADADGTLTGSCRSIEGVDIHAALTACAAFLERFGGHRQAAGLTMKRENLDAFRDAMDAWLAANVPAAAYVPALEYDMALDFDDVTPAFIHALDALQPTGFGNPMPVFRATAQVVDARAVGAEGAHLRLTLAQGGHRLGAIACRQGALKERLADRVDALFVPGFNEYMGRTEPQLEVKALADADGIGQIRAKLGAEASLQCEFLTQLFYNKRIYRPDRGAPETDLRAVEAFLAAEPQGTLILAADLSGAAELLRRLDPIAPDVCFGAMPADPRAFNALCAYPPAAPVPRGYRRVILASVPEEYLPDAPGAEVLRLPGRAAWTAGMPDLDGLRAAYRAVMRAGQRPVYFRTLEQLACVTAEEAGLDRPGAAAAILAMADMGLFELELSNPIRVRRSDRRRATPEESAVWQALLRWRTDGEIE